MVPQVGERFKRSVGESLKKTVAAGQKWTCAMCQQMLPATFEVDHKIALYLGGTNERSNLQALCPNCHRAKTVEEGLSSRARKEEEMRLATRRAQVQIYFDEVAGSSVPAQLVQHIMHTYCGWPKERVASWLSDMGYVTQEALVFYPKITWKYVWASAGSQMMLERDQPVHNLKLKPNAPFTLRETAQMRAEREMQASRFRAANAEEVQKAAQRVAQRTRGRPPRPPPSPRGDGVKPTDMSVLFEEFRFNRE
jgi:hypothetical protein